jgi:hypothetical protein
MTRKKILGSHVKRLLSGVSDHGKRHLTEVETDLLQTSLLLEEAIDKLTRNFMAIHDTVTRSKPPSACCWKAACRPRNRSRSWRP